MTVLVLVWRRVSGALRDLAPIIGVIAFFQIVVLQQPFPDLANVIVGLICVVAGLTPKRSFFGLDLTARGNVVLFLVVETRARDILEQIRSAGRFDEEPGAGVAFQIAIEDAVGLSSQLSVMRERLEEEL